MMRVDARAIGRAVQQRLPRAFDEAWLRETWSGAHGRLRLANHVDEVHATAYLGESTLSGEASMVGVIRRRSGGEVGSASRTVSLQPNGRLNVHHSELSLDESVHRTGFATRFNDAAHEHYARAGVDDVTLSAGLSAGGYVWARAGFKLAPAAGVAGEPAQALARAKAIRALAADALEHGRISTAEHARLAPRLVGDAGELAPDTLTSVRELAAIPRLGEKVLAGSTWKGMRTVDAPEPWWTTTPAGIPDALRDSRAGVAHLRHELDVPDVVQHLRRDAALQLPDALEPVALTRMLERASARGKLRLVGTGNALAAVDLIEPRVRTVAPMRVLDRSGMQVGSVRFVVETASDGTLVAERAYQSFPTDAAGRRALHAATNDALRGAGVERLEAQVRVGRGLDTFEPREYVLV